MSAVPPLSVSHTNKDSANVRMFATVGGLFVPCMSVKVEQTSYGIADTLTITTPLSLNASLDHAARSQKMTPYPIEISIAFVGQGKPVSYLKLCRGLIDEIESDYDTDVITFHGRGLLATLIDARVSLKPNMSSTVTNVITQLITRYSKFTPVVASSKNLAGTILKTDFVSMSRNLRALDFIQILARAEGWTVRVVANSIVVGPPPDPFSTPILTKVYSDGDLLSLKTKHNALHNKNIKVKVVSYQQGTKAKVSAKKGPGPYTKLLGLPVPASPTKATRGAGTRGGIISGTTTVGERDNVEEYVIPLVGLTKQNAEDRALSIANEINQHEFVADVIFLPTVADFRTLINNSPDFHINLVGCSQVSNDGIYYMKHVDWDWDISASAGITIHAEMVNHPLPVPSGNQANASIDPAGGLPKVGP